MLGLAPLKGPTPVFQPSLVRWALHQRLSQHFLHVPFEKETGRQGLSCGTSSANDGDPVPLLDAGPSCKLGATDAVDEAPHITIAHESPRLVDRPHSLRGVPHHQVVPLLPPLLELLGILSPQAGKGNVFLLPLGELLVPVKEAPEPTLGSFETWRKLFRLCYNLVSVGATGRLSLSFLSLSAERRGRLPRF